MSAPAVRDRRGVAARSGWVSDLALGVRLAIGGGSWARLALTAVGVGLGVAVLLLAAALPAAQTARDERAAAVMTVPTPDGAAASVLHVWDPTYFRGEPVSVDRFEVVGDNPPVPLGIDRLPAPGEMIVSPALADLLASEDGALLRPRLPYTQVGVIADAGLVAPNTLIAYVGADLDPAKASGVTFGSTDEAGTPVAMILLGLVGGAVVLLPVLVLLAASTRIAAAARERRLAAFRLVGADTGQASRLASGEALVSAVLGVVIGLVLFLVGREGVAHVELFGISVFATDLLPPLPAFAVVMVVVPALAVLTAVVSLRRAMVNPLGATRDSSPPRRRLWWRLVPLGAGVALLSTQVGAFGSAEDPGNLRIAVVLAGLVLTGISVPVLLPWLVQSAVGPLSGGPPSWQLAIRRIQLDSGTAARAAGGLAAVLTAAVAFQTLLASAFAENIDWSRQAIGDVEGRLVSISGPELDAATTSGLANLDGVRGVRVVEQSYAQLGSGDDASGFLVVIAPCDTIRTFARVADCADGDAFITRQPPDDSVTFGGYTVPEPGVEATFLDNRGDGEPIPLGTWAVPADVTTVESLPSDVSPTAPGTVVVTPSLAPQFPSAFRTSADVVVDPENRDVAEHIANALVGSPDAFVYSYDGGGDQLTQLRNTLVAGAIVVLLLAAASLLIVSVEQVRERRRQLAALAASGVGTRTLASSILWQATVPFGVATIASLGVGAGLGVLMMRVFDEPAAIDWSGMALLAGTATVAVLAVTGLTLPSLRRATRPEGLRME